MTSLSSFKKIGGDFCVLTTCQNTHGFRAKQQVLAFPQNSMSVHDNKR